MGEIVDVSKYPEGLDILCEKLDIPVPKDDIEGRKKYIEELVINFVMSGLY